MATIKAGDINLEYHVEGEGPPLLMIMGFGGQASSWGRPVIDLLNGHFATIRVSNRGTGTSDRPDVPTTVRMMADDAANLLDAIEVERAHVFGVSMGGMIAQELVLNHPERVNGLVLGCTTTAMRRGPLPDPETGQMMTPVPGLTREQQIRKAWPAMCTPEFVENDTAFLETMLESSLTNPTPLDTILKQSQAVMSFDSYDRATTIEAPTLVIHGDRDRMMPLPHGQTLAERIPGAEFVLIPGQAHMFFWEKPEETARIVTKFLSRIPASV